MLSKTRGLITHLKGGSNIIIYELTLDIDVIMEL